MKVAWKLWWYVDQMRLTYVELAVTGADLIAGVTERPLPPGWLTAPIGQLR